MTTRLVTAAGAAALLLLGSAADARAQEYRIGGRDVAIYNLAGEARVVGGGGSEVVVRVTRRGRDGDRLSVEVGEVGGRQALRVVYPDDDVVYPAMGRGSTTTLRVLSDGTFGEGRDGERVRITGGGRGMEAWADLEIVVPAGRNLSLRVAAGDVDVTNVEGSVMVDTGSGHVGVGGLRGALLVDTGSGSVEVRDVEGDVDVDTGSGRVELRDVRGDRIRVDTGSGSVRATGVTGSTVEIDTGSGSIDLARVTSADVVLDTGSGGVEVELMTDVERLDIDTGSGSVTVRMPEGVGAEVEVETGSGGIDVDLPVRVRSVQRDYLLGTIGDGRGRIRVDTGSGSIRLIRGR